MTGERVSTSTIREAARSNVPGLATRILTTGMVRLDSAQATRRAVLYVQELGDPPVPADLASWFTERGFQFYIAGVRLPLGALSARNAERDLRGVFADLDAAAACLRGPDGMVSVVVTARGRGAFAAALWSASRAATDARHADALVLSAPVWPAHVILQLDIACPVLIVEGEIDGGAGSQRTRPQRPGRLRPGKPSRNSAPSTLGRHVTWIALADADSDSDEPLFLTELGRWLGAYMYGLGRDRLL
jgi:hypothetical protein